MKHLSSYGLAVCGVVGMLAGCAGGSTSALVSGEAAGNLRGVQSSAQHSEGYVFLVKPHTHRDLHTSWRSPKLKGNHAGALLFESDFGTDDVYVYSLPKLTLMATITGFGNWPQGMCNDDAGHVWVTVAHANAIYEYDNNVSLVNTISDPYGWPAACAWDKRTGNLAVAHVSDSGGYGSLIIYPGGTGTPTAYTDPDIQYYYDVAYDSRGNLLVSGQSCSYSPYVCTYKLASLPRAGNSLETLTINGAMYSPGGLQWDSGAQEWLAGDQECTNTFKPETSCTRWLSVAGNSATVGATIALNSSLGTPACDMTQTVRMGGKLAGGDYEYPPEYYTSTNMLYGECTGGFSFAPSNEYRWLLTGGNPIKSSTNTPVAPSGVAVSE